MLVNSFMSCSGQFNNIYIIKSKPHEGIEPSTLRLKVWCSTDWANEAGAYCRVRTYADYCPVDLKSTALTTRPSMLNSLMSCWTIFVISFSKIQFWKKISSEWFRSIDLRVMSPTRFRCATLLNNSLVSCLGLDLLINIKRSRWDSNPQSSD